MSVDVDEVLRSQDGVISRRQALAAGPRPDDHHRAVAGGQWRAVFPGVYLARQHDLSDGVRLRAAVLWCGPEASACGVAAAWWHGLWPACPSEVDIKVSSEALAEEDARHAVDEQAVEYPGEH